MLIAAERLLIKLRQPASRAAELIELRRRLRAELASQPSPDELARARDVHAAKLAVVEQLGEVASCSSCARGQPWPNGHYTGGDCCCGITNEVFDDHEVGALVRAGTQPRDLTPPRDAHAGCAFRGAGGCSLEVEHRPARCVHYICDQLRRELFDRGRLDAAEAGLAALNRAMQHFTAARRTRLDREVVDPLIDALADAARR